MTNTSYTFRVQKQKRLIKIERGVLDKGCSLVITCFPTTEARTRIPMC